jgi:D-inositol-3-phosphate glycosyltransferase
MQDQGHEAEILSFSLQYPSLFFPGNTQKETRSPAPGNLRIHTLINSINPFNWIRVARFIYRFRPDLIIVQHWIPFIAISLGSILRMVHKPLPKVIAICHNVIPHEPHAGALWLTRYFLKKCDGYLVLSESVKDDLARLNLMGLSAYHPHPIYDFYGNAVSREKAAGHFKTDPKGKYLLFFGLIREYKGLDIAIKAMRDKRIREMGVKLIVAGEFYEDEKKYLDLVRENDLEDQIIFVREYVPVNEVCHYFCIADMVVQTYKTATQSGVTQIAYHFERPMLVTNVGGLAEIVPHGKVGYVTEKDPQSVSDAIVDFYENRREAEFIANIAREKNRFSWKSFVRTILELHTAIKS